MKLVAALCAGCRMMQAAAPHPPGCQQRLPKPPMDDEWVVYGGGVVQNRHQSARRLRFAPNVTTMPDGAFLNRRLVEIELGNVTDIGKGAFHFCDALQVVSIPSTAVTIGCNAFLNCSQLREAKLREGLQMIGNGSFFKCQSLEHITIPSSVTFVGPGAFAGCTNLTDVTLLEGLQSIGHWSFMGCRALEQINIPPVAFVIDLDQSSCHVMRSTMPKPHTSTLVISKWMQYRSPSQLQRAEAKVHEILGLLPQTEDRGSGRGRRIFHLRKWFTYCDLSDISTMLELAIWKARMDDDELDANARRASRERCGNDLNVIVPGVLLYLK